MSAKDMFYSKGTVFSKAEERAYAREELVFNVTEDLLVMLEELDITKAELSRRLGKSKSYVTQVLSGSRNMTLGSFSDICFALGFKPEIKIPVKLMDENEGWEQSKEPTCTVLKLDNRKNKNIHSDFLREETTSWSKPKKVA